MDVKEAVRKAKDYVADLFVEEGVRSVRLEEVVLDESPYLWKITVSFVRQESTTGEAILSALGGDSRTSKVVEINKSGRVISVMNRP